jgi:predicted nucleic acid-binding protein
LAQNLSNKHVVLDNNILSDFGGVGRLGLLNRILEDSMVVLSPEVREQVRKEVKIDELRFQVKPFDSEGDYKNATRLRREQKGLGAADISCLVLARKYDGICASNDKLVRKVAKREGILVIGSIGLLECAIARSILTHREAADILLKTIEIGAFIEQKLVNSFLKRR